MDSYATIEYADAYLSGLIGTEAWASVPTYEKERRNDWVVIYGFL